MSAPSIPGRTMSIIALVLPFVCFWPIGLILAIIAFVQGKGHPRGLAIAALIVNSVMGALFVLLVAAAPDTRVDDSAPAINAANAHAIADAIEAEVDADR